MNYNYSDDEYDEGEWYEDAAQYGGGSFRSTEYGHGHGSTAFGAVNGGEEGGSVVKRRKTSRACDVCRKRKVRCDFIVLPSGELQKCLNCSLNNIECTFLHEIKPRRTSKEYVRGLEAKIARVEKILEILCPDPSLRNGMLEREDAPIPPAVAQTLAQHGHGFTNHFSAMVKMFSESTGKDPVEAAMHGIRSHLYSRYPPGEGVPVPDEDEPQSPLQEVTRDMQKSEGHFRISDINYTEELKREVDPSKIYIGKSSAHTILGYVFAMKEELSKESSINSKASGLQDGSPSSGDKTGAIDSEESPRSIKEEDSALYRGIRRPGFWGPLPWEDKVFRNRETISPEASTAPAFTFPPPDLFATLVEHYFAHVNIDMPLLHRPTFEKDLAAGLHRRSKRFGAVALLVCAVGAKYSDDPRIKMHGPEGLGGSGGDRDAETVPPSPFKAFPDFSEERMNHMMKESRGWRLFEQAWTTMDLRLVVAPPSLYDLQCYSLATVYLLGSAIPQPTWTLVGIGIRIAQEVGAHRKKAVPRESERAFEDELWKRACWVLVTLDRFTSAATGRPSALLEEDFDLDLPVECDDEYWDNPNPSMRFSQPEGKPALPTAFCMMIRLNQVLAICLRSLYALDWQRKVPLGGKDSIKPKIVEEIDSAMNRWMDTMPPHLRWDPDQPDDRYFMQSFRLYTSFYYLQILVHRQFIPLPNRQPNPNYPFPSLSICVNAGKNIIRMSKRMVERKGEVPMFSPILLITSAIVILMRVWGLGRAGKLSDKARKADMDDINLALDVLKFAEYRWFMAGRLWDLLNGLSKAEPRYLQNQAAASGDAESSSPGDKSDSPGRGKEQSAPHMASHQQPSQTNLNASANPTFLARSSLPPHQHGTPGRSREGQGDLRWSNPSRHTDPSHGGTTGGSSLPNRSLETMGVQPAARGIIPTADLGARWQMPVNVGNQSLAGKGAYHSPGEGPAAGPAASQHVDLPSWAMLNSFEPGFAPRLDEPLLNFTPAQLTMATPYPQWEQQDGQWRQVPFGLAQQDPMPWQGDRPTYPVEDGDAVRRQLEQVAVGFDPVSGRPLDGGHVHNHGIGGFDQEIRAFLGLDAQWGPSQETGGVNGGAGSIPVEETAGSSRIGGATMLDEWDSLMAGVSDLTNRYELDFVLSGQGAAGQF